MFVVSISSQKGGVGKTTIALNLGLALARAGTKTLLTEFDAQGSLGLSLGLADRARPGIAEVLTGAENVDAVMQKTREPNLSVLSVGRVDPTTVAGFEDALTRPGAIGNILDAARAQGFDLVLIDCPAGLGKVTTRALENATHALSPLQAEPPSPMAAVLHIAMWRARVEALKLSSEEAGRSLPRKVAESLDLPLVWLPDQATLGGDHPALEEPMPALSVLCEGLESMLA